MANPSLQFGFKSFDFFFDRQRVLSRLSNKEARVLRKTGAVGRREIRKRVRPAPKRNRKKRSKYPYYHVSPNAGLRYVLYVYNPNRGSVVIGPQKFGVSSRRYRQQQRSIKNKPTKPIPQLINEGGTVVRQYRYKSGRTYQVTKRYRSFPYVDDAFAPTMRAFRRNLETEGL